jgi:hypothetical protein
MCTFRSPSCGPLHCTMPCLIASAPLPNPFLPPFPPALPRTAPNHPKPDPALTPVIAVGCRYFDLEPWLQGPRCFKCGGLGHIARDCPEGPRERPCFLCAKLGHDSRDCPYSELTLRTLGRGTPPLSALLHCRWLPPMSGRLMGVFAGGRAVRVADLTFLVLACLQACVGDASDQATWQGTAPTCQGEQQNVAPSIGV